MFDNNSNTRVERSPTTVTSTSNTVEFISEKNETLLSTTPSSNNPNMSAINSHSSLEKGGRTIGCWPKVNNHQQQTDIRLFDSYDVDAKPLLERVGISDSSKPFEEILVYGSSALRTPSISVTSDESSMQQQRLIQINAPKKSETSPYQDQEDNETERVKDDGSLIEWL